MALYQITTRQDGNVLDREIRRQKPAAFQAYRAAVWSAIRSQGGLDTRWGHKAMAQCEGAAENCSLYTVTVRDLDVTFERLS